MPRKRPGASEWWSTAKRRERARKSQYHVGEPAGGMSEAHCGRQRLAFTWALPPARLCEDLPEADPPRPYLGRGEPHRSRTRPV